MKLAGTSETGWVVVDLADVAKAITALRDSAVRRRAQREQREQPRLGLARR